MQQRIRYVEVLLSTVITDAKFQRPPDDGRIKRYGQKFNQRLFGTPEIAELDGNLYVIDGQHRIEAGKLAGLKRARMRIHYDLTYEEIVALYRKFNNEHKKLLSIDDFNAALEQKDPDALSLRDKVETAGFKIGRGQSFAVINAVGELRKMYNRDESLITTTLLFCLAFQEYGYSLNGNLIGGIHLILSKQPDINYKRLQKVLARKSPKFWTGAAADLATSSDTRSVRVAMLIHREYNKNLRAAKNLLPDTTYS